MQVGIWIYMAFVVMSSVYKGTYAVDIPVRSVRKPVGSEDLSKTNKPVAFSKHASRRSV